jgi:hypothetical protein
MKKPLCAPPLRELLDRYRETLADIVGRGIGPTVNGEYLHWDKLRHLDPPPGIDHHQWWAGIKLARASSQRFLPLADVGHRPFCTR